MPTYIALLRAVNVGKRAYPMAQLRELLTEQGYADVASHIQTGNVRVDTSVRSVSKVAADLERLFAADRGFEVPTIVVTVAELAALSGAIDEIEAEGPPTRSHYVSVLKEKPSAAAAREFEERSTPAERVVVRHRAVHLLTDLPYHEAKLTNATVERHLGVATNRNAKVIRALAAKWAP